MLSTEQQLIVNNRLTNNLMTGTTALEPEQVVDRLLGVQAQYNGPALINLYNRLPQVSAADFQAKIQDAPIIKAWGNRQTLHFLTINRWQMYVQLFANKETWARKYLLGNNYNPDEVFDRFGQYLNNNQQFTRDDLFQEFGPDADVFFTWSALILHASLRGKLYLPTLDNQNTLFHSIQPSFEQSFADCLQDYYQAYFAAYGPATLQDFLHFVGFSKQYLQIATQQLPELEATEIAGRTYYSVQPVKADLDVPEVIMLSKFDPLLVGYQDKNWLTTKYQQQVWRKAGQISPVVLINGEFSGTWRYQLTGTKLNATIWCAKIINQRRQRIIKKKLQEYATLFGKQLGTITYTGKIYGSKK